MFEVVWQEERPAAVYWVERRSLLDPEAKWVREPYGPYQDLEDARYVAGGPVQYQYRIVRQEIEK